MSFVVSCQCGKQFKVRDDQAGKKAKCPGCGTPLTLKPPPPPPPADESDPFANFDLEAAAAMERNAVVDENQGPHVTLPPPPPPPSKAKGTAAPQGLAYARPAGKAAAASGDSDLSVGEWLLCIFCGGIACIMGIVFLVQGKPKGGKMIGFAFLFNFLWVLVQLGIQFFVLGG